MTWPGDPFLRITPVAAEGNGPNALLQNHPFMGLHPPLLYLGYTGLAIPFAFGVAALITGRTDEEWLGIVRRWTLVPVDLPDRWASWPAHGGATRCWAGAATGPGIRSRTPRCCHG